MSRAFTPTTTERKPTMSKLSNGLRHNIMLPLVSKHDTDALKSFALTMSIVFPVVFMLLLPWVLSAAVPIWPVYLSIGLSALYIFAASLLYYPYLLWMIIASVLGFINTRLILALAYYLLIVPTGLFMQWRKGLQYKQLESSQSAWVKREKIPNKDNLKDPF
jgi:hypothetical protein